MDIPFPYQNELNGGGGVGPSATDVPADQPGTRPAPSAAMGYYHQTVRSSIDISTKASLTGVEINKRGSDLSSKTALIHDQVLPNLVESNRLTNSINEVLEKETFPLVLSIADLLKKIEAEATALGVNRKRQAMLRKVRAEVDERHRRREEEKQKAAAQKAQQHASQPKPSQPTSTSPGADAAAKEEGAPPAANESQSQDAVEHHQEEAGKAVEGKSSEGEDSAPGATAQAAEASPSIE
jgi:hypothetical protein